MGSVLNSEGRIANMLVRSLDRSPGSENKKQSKPTLKKTFRTPIALPVEVVVVVVAGGGGRRVSFNAYVSHIDHSDQGYQK